jgi:predicted outer membrane repeat protein
VIMMKRLLLRQTHAIPPASIRGQRNALSRPLALLIALGAALDAPKASAASFVILDGDIAALKEAITTANSNGEDDTISLAANGSYVLITTDNTPDGFEFNGLPVITGDNGHTLTLAGNGATIARSNADGTPEFRIVDLDGATVEMSGLTLTNGRADNDGGAIRSMESELVLTDCTLADNYSGESGGGVSSLIGFTNPDPTSALTLVRCTFERNFAEDNGGGVVGAVVTQVTVSHCIFRDNIAYSGEFESDTFGGAMALVGIPDLFPGAVAITDCLFSGNKADPDASASVRAHTGGALALMDLEDVTMTRCTFTDNSVLGDSEGGAIGTRGAGTFTVRDSIFHNNTSETFGGAILNSGDMLIENCTFAGNSSGGFGGGILNAGAMTVAKSTFRGNKAGAGGAVVNGTPFDDITSAASMTVINCTLSDNHALLSDPDYGFGGAILNSEGDLIVRNSTFSGNTAAGPSGGWDIHNTSVTGGSAASLALGQNIFSSPGSSILNEDSALSLGYNLSNDDGGGVLTHPTDILNTDPILGPLQDNGGPTWTHALLNGSPALDRIPGAADVDFPATDQRGLARPQGAAADIGAYELAAAAEDTEPPTIIDCPTDLVANATHPAGAVVNYTPPSASDNVALASFECDWLPGDTFPIGTTIVTCLATDTAGLTAECVFSVHVKGALEQTCDLIEAVARLRIHHAIKTRLLAKLAVAKVALAWDRPAVARPALRAFILEARAQTGKKLTTAQAHRLITEATRILKVIGR